MASYIGQTGLIDGIFSGDYMLRLMTKSTHDFDANSTQAGSSILEADATNVRSNSAGINNPSPVIAHGSTFPEIDEKGWYVDKPRAKGDFPNVPYWRKREWNEAEKATNLSTIPGEERRKKGPTRMANGENVSFKFITDANGVAIDGERAQTIRRRFREFCKYLHNNGKAPATWQRGIDTEIVTAYHHWMRTQCYELQLCEDNWKADKVAILSNYSQWKKKYEQQLAEQAEKARKAAKKHKKHRHAKADAAPADKPAAQDPLVEDNVTGTEHPVEPLLNATLYRFSASPPPPLPAIRARSERSQSPAKGPAAKRPRTNSSNRSVLLPEQDEAVSTVPPVTDELSSPTISNGPMGLSDKVSMPNPLAGLTWSSTAPASSTSQVIDPTHTNTGAPLRSIPPAGVDSIYVSESETVTTATMGINRDASDVPSIGASMSSAADNLVAPSAALHEAPGDIAEVPVTVPTAVNATAPQNKGKKRAPKPRKVTTQAWPPPDDDSHARPKDVCARIWSTKNPDGSREEFDLWYKNLSPYKRNRYFVIPYGSFERQRDVNAATDRGTLLLQTMMLHRYHHATAYTLETIQVDHDADGLRRIPTWPQYYTTASVKAALTTP
ncbi:hypothetical protein FKP32DRAFT_1678295 [Trametes sanguinea]|nr:hypothetical protein FKP32DRAFT_1678295 [Trametes sanguinea]